ncbi:MAG: hypothetical protein LC723_06960, partial [Actinobacteria bacterium]|nr:hypothetical protein [Actinomycetota bacterium]
MLKLPVTVQDPDDQLLLTKRSFVTLSLLGGFPDGLTDIDVLGYCGHDSPPFKTQGTAPQERHTQLYPA